MSWYFQIKLTILIYCVYYSCSYYFTKVSVKGRQVSINYGSIHLGNFDQADCNGRKGFGSSRVLSRNIMSLHSYNNGRPDAAISAFPPLTSNTTSLTKYLDSLKSDSQMNNQQRQYKKWRSTILYIQQLSTNELLQLTSQTFSNRKYFDDLIASMNTASQQNELIGLYITSTLLDILFGSLVVPSLHISSALKNVLGLMSLSYPFLVALIGYSSPQLITKAANFFANKFKKESFDKEKERVIYHEAGHILVGYLSGVAVQSYSVDDNMSSHAAVDIDPEIFTFAMNAPDKGDNYRAVSSTSTTTLGSLLTVALAGVVAESLRFGNCKGGGQDLLVARTIMQLGNVSPADYMGYLRWSVGKCLSLLRLNRNALDELALAIKERKSIEECYNIIEDTNE